MRYLLLILSLVSSHWVNGQATTAELLTPPQMSYGRAAALKELQLYHATLLRDVESKNAAERRRVLDECGDQIRAFARQGEYPKTYKDGIYRAHALVKGAVCEETEVEIKDNRIAWNEDTDVTVVSKPIRNGVGWVLVTTKTTRHSFVYEFYLIY